MKRPRQRYNRSSAVLLYSLSALALAMTLGVGGFFVYTLALRTRYRAMALEFNDAFLKSTSVTLSSGEDSFSVTPDSAEYYNEFLLDSNTAVFSRKNVEPSDTSISLILDSGQLTFTRAEDGTAIAVRWSSGEEEQNYIVRSLYTFPQLTAYFSNMKRALGSDSAGGT